MDPQQNQPNPMYSVEPQVTQPAVSPPMPPVTNMPLNVPAPPKKSPKLPLIIGGVIIAVLLLGFGAYKLFFSKSKTDKPQAVETTTLAETDCYKVKIPKERVDEPTIDTTRCDIGVKTFAVDFYDFEGLSYGKTGDERDNLSAKDLFNQVFNVDPGTGQSIMTQFYTTEEIKVDGQDAYKVTFDDHNKLRKVLVLSKSKGYGNKAFFAFSGYYYNDFFKTSFDSILSSLEYK